MRAIIIGAGIGGCLAGMALKQQGVDVQIYESVREIQPLGVGINILPHAMAVLDGLGLLSLLEPVGVPTAELAFFNKHGQLIWREPRGRLAGYPVPQISIHRGKLQMCLFEAAVERLGREAIVTGHSLVSFTPGDSSTLPTVTLENRHTGETVTDSADILIGADGIHSTVRKTFYPEEGIPHWSGNILWRSTTVRKPFLTGRSMFMAGHLPHKFVAYPITEPDADGNQVINWIAELRSTEPLTGREDWNKRVDKSIFADRFADWNFDWLNIPELIESAGEVLEFPMVDRDPLPAWTFGRTTLLGDAAHPMYPIGSNGASQAILDGRALADSLREHSDIETALRAYDDARRTATSKIVLSNRQHGPERVLDMAEERSPSGFADVADVFAAGELEEISAMYKQVAGFSRPKGP
jgi:5-methylphenazine-1-carboxylate 1-monooxygenase